MKKKAINQQRGSVILPFVVSLLVGLILLGGVQIGYYFFMKRELQNTVDLAVLSGVQLLSDGISPSDGCNKAIEAAKANAIQNFSRHDDLNNGPLAFQCGTWRSSLPAPKHFEGKTDAQGNYNALRATITYDALPFLPFSSATVIRVEAIAKKEFQPMAAFSVGPQLLRLDNGVLTNILKSVGLDLTETQLLSYKGLANVMITPSGLLKNLGIEVPADLTVGGFQELLAGDVGVKALINVLDASIAVADQRGLLALDQLGVLNLVRSKLDPLALSLQLFSDNVQNGLFALIETPSEKINAALNTEVSLGSILDVMLGVATHDHALELGDVEPILNLGGLLRVEAQASVIEHPSIGIGGPGTTAYSSNIRVFARVCLDTSGECKGTGEQSGGSTSLLGGLLGSLIKLKVDLPLVIELVNGKGTLGQMCHATDAQGRNAADITVETHVGDICVGAFDLQATQGTLKHPFSGVMSCVNKLESNPSDFKHKILNLSLLNVPLASLETSLAIPALTTEETKTFYFHDPRIEPGNIGNNTKWMPESGNNLSVGTTIKKLVDAVLAAVVGDSLGHSGSLPGNLGDRVAQQIWDNAKQQKAEQSPGGCNDVKERDCRKSILELAQSNIKAGLSGLQGFIGNLLGGTLGLVGDLLTLNIVGVLNNLGGVLGTVLGGVGELLVGDGCTHGGLGELFGQTGNETGCINLLSDSPSMSGKTEGQPNALLVILGLLTNLLQGPLDALGNQLLSPLLNGLGLKIGQVETTLISLDCNSGAQLVY
ncbi:MAG: pilus assembly protein TadG-related protein [Advenella sp.]